MKNRALIVLLLEWHRQLTDALDTAKAMLPDPEPLRVRQWKYFGPHFSAPTEDTPADQWHWITEHRTPPALFNLEQTINRAGEQIQALGVMQ